MYPAVLDGALRFDDGWTLVEDLLRTAGGSTPTGPLFTTSNGYVGLRGRAREPFGDDGLVLLAGCHETRPYAHPEKTFGSPEHYQTIVPVTDPDGTTYRVLDGDRVALHHGDERIEVPAGGSVTRETGASTIGRG